MTTSISSPRVFSILLPSLRCGALFGAILLLTSCDGVKKEAATRPADSPASTVKQTAALSPASLKRISESCAAVRLPDGMIRQGIVINGGRDSSGKSEHLVLTVAPADVKAIFFACGDPDKPAILTAKRQGLFPNGLSIFSTSTKQNLTSYKRGPSTAAKSYHAFRLIAGDPLPAEEMSRIRSEMDAALKAVNDAQRERFESMRPERRAGMRTPPDQSSRDNEPNAKLTEINSRLKFPIQNIAIEETAAAPSLGELESFGAALDNTLLTSSDMNVLAIRHEGKWVNIDETLAAVPATPEQVKLSVNGSNTTVNLECSLLWKLPPESAGFSMVAATTFELESKGSGTLEERLGRVARTPFPQSGRTRSLSQTLDWSGLPTTLWIRIYDDAHPEKPLIDETILLDYPKTFAAKWAKPPSPLIVLPEPAPDLPGDFVKDRSVIQVQGTVLDLINAGDGSILMVHSDKAPFWAALDLKSGTIENPPWKTTADTLLATQAGKIYLIDRKSRMVEVWNISPQKREAVKLLEVDGEIISVAAPRSSPNLPILVTTTTGACFLTSSDFKTVDCGIELSPIFAKAQHTNYNLPRLNPATIRVRASADGSIYTINGLGVENEVDEFKTISLTMDGGLVLNAEVKQPSIIASNGRLLARDYPDHAGRDLMARGSRRWGSFPAAQGAIEFRSKDGNDPICALNAAPVVPPALNASGSSRLAFDRGLYLDSSTGALILPDADRLHLLHLRLPEAEMQTPEFVFSDETVTLPRPAGTGHRITSSIGGETTVSGTIQSWTVPATANRSSSTVRIDWTGELGSPMTRTLKFTVIQRPSMPVAISPDGSRSLPLPRRAILHTSQSPAGVAGAGHVLLTADGDKKSAWNLATGELLCAIETRSRLFFGDVDQLYSLEQSGTLKSYEISTGKEIKSRKFGSDSSGDRQGLSSVATGSASRSPLIAITYDGGQNYVSQIDRDSLDMRLVDFGTAATPPIFRTRLESNASGSVFWAFATAIQREGNRVSLIHPAGLAVEGAPDATGRYMIGVNHFIDTGSNPPQKRSAESLPGCTKSAKLHLDQSGRYLIVSTYQQETNTNTYSVRPLDGVFQEIFQLKFGGQIGDGTPWMISATRALVLPVSGRSRFLGVYDFDIPTIQAALSQASSGE